jgi:hypothetical protein
MLALRHPLHAPRRQLLPPDLLLEPVADTKLFRQIFQTHTGPFVRLQNPAPQIIRIGSWHRSSARKIAKTNLLSSSPLGYSN